MLWIRWGFMHHCVSIQAQCGKAMFATWLLWGEILELPEQHNL